jgi:hypothetical protein
VFCVAVGSRAINYGAEFKTLAERWNGSTWSTMTTTNPAADIQLSGVSCTSTVFCVAVSTMPVGSHRGYYQTLAERWNGSTWSTMTTTNPAATSGDYFVGVSCTSATFCVGVGAINNGGVDQTLAERWNGSTWSTMTTTNPAATDYLSNVSCSSASYCVAAGGSGNGGFTESYSNPLGAV